MTIKEYYSYYKINKKYPIKLSLGSDSTIDDFYKNCITPHILPEKSVLAWHNMLMDYANRPDAIYWIRYYESGSKASGRWNNRRACVTRFSDGFLYAFVSNFDAHEILNMVRLGVDPDVNEFADLMSSFKYPMHFDQGKSCEESDINAYPNIGTPRGGILTFEHWYLAHINDIKSEFIRDDGTYRAIDISSAEGVRIYPRGSMADWKLDKVSEHMIRELPYSLSPEQKKLVKAHFLRFVDPLNYYVTPGPKYEKNAVCLRIGEYTPLNMYISEKYEALYGSNVMDAFRKAALLKAPVYLSSTGEDKINIFYGDIKVQDEKSNRLPSVSKIIASSKETEEKTSIGQYAKRVFQKLIEGNLLSTEMIEKLMDKAYCAKELSISFPVLVEKNRSDYEKQRYYRDVIAGRFLISSQWYEKSRNKIQEWLICNKLNLTD